MDFILRKMAHVFEFAVLTRLGIRANQHSWPTRKMAHWVLWSAAFSLLYAASDEYHQSFVPGRGPSVLDVMIDSVGIALASWFFWFRAPGEPS